MRTRNAPTQFRNRMLRSLVATLLVGFAIAPPPIVLAQPTEPTAIGVQRQVDSQAYPIRCPQLVETSIAAVSRPSLPDALVASWVYSNGPSPLTCPSQYGAAASTDGGQNWTPYPQAGWGGDPMTCADQTSESLWVGVAHGGANGGIQVAKWNGAGFDAPVAAVSGIDCDKAFMAAGPRIGQPGTTRLYVSYWSSAGSSLTWSDNLGTTQAGWATPIPLPTLPSGLPYDIATLPRVGPNGQLYIITKDNAFGIYLIRSLAADTSSQPIFDEPIKIATRLDTWDYARSDTNSRIPGQFNAAPYTYGAVDPVNGTLYCVYFDTTSCLCTCCPQTWVSSDVDLYLTKSTNQGTTWETPQRILGDDPKPYDQFFAWLEVDTSHRLHLVFFDTRGDAHTDAATPPPGLRTRYAWSTNAGATWTDATVAPYWTVSPPPPTPSVWIADDTWYGEYIGLAATPNRVYPIYPAPLGPGIDPPDGRIWTNIITWD